jgi:para-aminobenzoate synthetase / 4-amino-4-deoxychorismate lyase
MLLFIYTRFENEPKLFISPKEVIACHDPAGLKKSFDRVESWLDKGFYAAGFLSYEAGYAFESTLAGRNDYGFPLLNMGCYAAPAADEGLFRGNPGQYSLGGITRSKSFPEYQKHIQRIRAYIAAGDVYQITYCLKTRFRFDGNGRSLFTDLLRAQPVPYPAYIDSGEFSILSLSPEMFIRKKGTLLRTKPMKGTWPRGANPFSDLAARFRLKFDEKNRAENLMITDLLRNDLGRVGSGIRVKKIFEVTGYKTLYQMTSSVDADIRKDTPLYEIFRALFPSGSVTGAPKIRAMQIVRGLEQEERKIYTGAIGYITPERDLFFSVPIRTLLIEDGRGEMGIGGGIIWDSTPQGEWDEGMLKSRFLFECAR